MVNPQVMELLPVFVCPAYVSLGLFLLRRKRTLDESAFLEPHFAPRVTFVLFRVVSCNFVDPFLLSAARLFRADAGTQRILRNANC